MTEGLTRADALHNLGLSVAFADVATERWRQVVEEGWTPEHDAAEHAQGQLSAAGAAYALSASAAAGVDHIIRSRLNHVAEGVWPWSGDWWKPRGARRNLVRAAALIIAEIERLDRLS